MEFTPKDPYGQRGSQKIVPWKWAGEKQVLSQSEKVFVQPNPPGLERVEKNKISRKSRKT